MAERALATIARISSIRDIPDAERIVTARIRGWDVVVGRDEFTVGDPVVYFEVDSLLPTQDARFAFLAPRGVRTQDGVEGHVLRTAKLRGQFSQGLALAHADFPEVSSAADGEDVTDALGITKWDPPLPAELAGQVRGLFPGTFRKTDEERIQNVPGLLDAGGQWVATEKVDGTSVSVFVIDGEEHVASRNYDICERDGNTLWGTARDLDLFTKIRDSWPGENVAVQGELFGPGIQANPLRVRTVQLRIFTIQRGGVALARADWPEWAADLSVPIHDVPFPATVEEALTLADKRASLIPGANGTIEGLVFRRTDTEVLPDGTRASFKVISRAYTLKHDR